MIEYVARKQGEARLYFSTREGRNLFARFTAELEGVLGVEYKENTTTLLIKFQEGSFAQRLIESLKPKEVHINKEDLHFYIQPLLKHPAVKLGFSLFMLGLPAGLISFGFCSMFLIPYLKTKF
ncbi:MAG: hypothetical protein ABWK04_08890 [Hydrogenobacter sp.]